MVYVECKPDEALVRLLKGLPRRQVIHEAGRNNVCGKLSSLNDRVALIDEDPGSIQPSYLKKCKLVEDLEGEGLKLYHDASRGNRIVALCPRLEDWVLRACRVARVDVAKFKLPSEPTALHSRVNARIDGFESLVARLLQKPPPAIRELKRLLG